MSSYETCGKTLNESCKKANSSIVSLSYWFYSILAADHCITNNSGQQGFCGAVN